MKHKILVLFFIFIALFACNKKPLPSNTTGTPVFFFDGKINNASKLFEAGNDSVYMYTKTTTNTKNEKTLQGWFANQANASSEPNLLFELINYKPIGSNNIAIELQNIKNFYSFSLDTISTIDTSKEFTFIPNDTTQAGASYLWQFDDGTTSTQKKPIKTFTTQGLHTVTFIYNAGCGTDTIVNTINTQFYDTCMTQFVISQIVVDTIQTTIVNPHSNFNYTWVWATGDSTHAGNASTALHTYSDSLNHTIQLIATSPVCSSMFYQKINSTSTLNKCLAGFTYTSQIKTKINTATSRTNSFVITWKNNGTTYKSYKSNSNANQSNNLILSTNSTSIYDIKTVSINGTTNCWLYNIANNNDSIPIQSSKLNFALGF